MSEERIFLTFHLEEDRVTASTREFVKPASTEEKADALIMTPDMTTTFQVSYLDLFAIHILLFDWFVLQLV